MTSERREKTFWEKHTANLPDLDDVFAYDTVKEVQVLDRRLGYVYYFVLISVIFYVVIYVFLIRKQYLEEEKTTGWIVTKVVNPGFDEGGKPWDIFDSVTNPGEQGATFVPTRVLVTRGQVQEGFCESPLHPCKADSDCDIDNDVLQQPKCSNSRCVRRQWCPAEEPGKPTTEEHIVHVERYDIWFSTSLHYHKLMLDVSTLDEKKPIKYPATHANTWSMKDLLRMANVDVKSIQHLGALIQVSQIINCDLNVQECKTTLEANNIDSVTGFNYMQNFFYVDNGVRKRDTYHFYGVRIMASATGFGVKTSLSMIVLQVSSAIAMLGCAQAAADFVLQYVVPERSHYKEYKIQTVDDVNSDD